MYNIVVYKCITSDENKKTKVSVKQNKTGNVTIYEDIRLVENDIPVTLRNSYTTILPENRPPKNTNFLKSIPYLYEASTQN